MSKIDQTIQNLVDADGPAVASARPLRLFLQWLGVTVVSTAVIVAFMSPREDLAVQLVSPLFLAEVTSLFLLVIATAMAAVWLCFPDLRQRPKIVYLPLPPLAVFILLSAYRVLHPGMTVIPPIEKVHGIDCAGCITILSLVPGFWMFHVLRRHATIYPRAAGAVSFLAAAGIGLLVLKFVEMNDSVLHLIQWHVTPMLVLAVIGVVLGKKYLSW